MGCLIYFLIGFLVYIISIALQYYGVDLDVTDTDGIFVVLFACVVLWPAWLIYLVIAITRYILKVK